MSNNWYYARGGQQQGPVSLEQLREMIHSGQVQSDDLVWSEGMENWVEAAKVPELHGESAAQAQPDAQQPYTRQPYTQQPYTQQAQPQSFPYGQPHAGYPYPYPGIQQDRSGQATTSFILSLLALLTAIIPCCGLPLAVTGLVLGIISRTSSNRGLAIAGIVISSIAIAVAALSAIIGVMVQLAGL